MLVLLTVDLYCGLKPLMHITRLGLTKPQTISYKNLHVVEIFERLRMFARIFSITSTGIFNKHDFCSCVSIINWLNCSRFSMVFKWNYFGQLDPSHKLFNTECEINFDSLASVNFELMPHCSISCQLNTFKFLCMENLSYLCCFNSFNHKYYARGNLRFVRWILSASLC